MTSSALAVTSEQTEFTTQQLAALRQLGIEKAPPGDLAIFLSYAQRTGLDPFSRQVYMIGRWDGRNKRTKWNIQTSIDGLRIVAQRSGDYAGQVGPEWCGEDGEWRDVWLANEPPTACRVGVMRQGFTQPLWAVALWREYGQESPIWKRMPALMLAKCAEALALRKAFPHDLSGLYTEDEMAQATPDNPQAVENVEPFTVEDIIVSINMAQDADALRSTWAAAREANLLDADWEGTSIGERILAAHEALQNPVDPYAPDTDDAKSPDEVVEAEVVEAGPYA